MIIRLSEQLEVPLRERNELLLAGGFAPAYPEHGLDSPELIDVQTALKDILTAHEPHPALILDRWWTLLDANDAVGQLVEGCASHLLDPPVNVCRLSLHPDGLARRILNLAQWRTHLIGQVERRAARTGDPRLAELARELSQYPGGVGPPVPPSAVVLPLRLAHPDGDLSYFSIAATVETAADITVAELTIETFYPADAHTARPDDDHHG